MSLRRGSTFSQLVFLRTASADRTVFVDRYGCRSRIPFRLSTAAEHFRLIQYPRSANITAAAIRTFDEGLRPPVFREAASSALNLWLAVFARIYAPRALSVLQFLSLNVGRFFVERSGDVVHVATGLPTPPGKTGDMQTGDPGGSAASAKLRVACSSTRRVFRHDISKNAVSGFSGGKKCVEAREPRVGSPARPYHDTDGGTMIRIGRFRAGVGSRTVWGCAAHPAPESVFAQPGSGGLELPVIVARSGPVSDIGVRPKASRAGCLRGCGSCNAATAEPRGAQHVSR